MGPDGTERLWTTRLRWRMRGAWQWPAFAVLTVADAIVLHELPFAGAGTGPVAALLLAGFFNLVAVAVVAPLAGMRVRRLRPSLPKMIADDYAGTALLALVTVALLAAGVAHRPSVQVARSEFAAEQAAIVRYVHSQAPREYVARLGEMDTWKPGPHLYRTCVPGDDPQHHLCLIVQTSGSTPDVRLDSDQRPNSSVAGPDNPGRMDR